MQDKSSKPRNRLLSLLLLPLLATFAHGAPPYYECFLGDDVTDASVAQAIKNKPGLRHVKFQLVSRVTDKGIAEVKNLPDLEMLDLNQVKMNGSALKCLHDLPKLKEVNLELTQIVNEDELKYLSNLNLRKVNFFGSPVGNVAAWYVSYIKTLQHINFSDTRVTDIGLKDLERLPEPRFIYLLHLPITDASALVLAKMKTLELLDIRGTQITDRGLKSLCTLPKLKTLLLSGSTTDAGIALFRGNKTISLLELNDSKITDAALKLVATMPKLKHLSIYRTNVSDAAIARLKSVRPDIAVFGPKPSAE